ncbi:MAG: PRC-barrel domain-containing protein [Alphaproteobacteria bacterium]|nr:PRC-barrel domain-containing protein [Alphaproteobacteria bacterium]
MTAGTYIRRFTATTAVALLLTGAARAQTTPPAAGPTSPPAAATTPSTAAPKPLPPAVSPLAREDVSKIIGSTVYGPDDKKIGTVSTLLLQPGTKQITKFVVAEGGVLGIGAHLVALPMEEFAWDQSKGVFKVSYSSDELKAMPEWKEQVSQVQ